MKRYSEEDVEKQDIKVQHLERVKQQAWHRMFEAQKAYDRAVIEYHSAVDGLNMMNWSNRT